MQICYQTLQRWIFNIELIIVICVGAKQVLVHKASVGMLMAFLGYRALLIESVTSLLQSIINFKLMGIQLLRLSDIVLQDPEHIPGLKAYQTYISGALTLNQLSFQYNTYTPAIISMLNLDIHAGEKIAIVGPSGCGKSTLLKIMMGLLSPSTGIILIDGICLQDIGIYNYRQNIAAVLQDDVLLSGSIIDNIAFFDDNIDIARVYTVAQQACIHDFILSCPMGYNTLVGESGQTVSGGQKQRILLARALYKQPKILFLDEATSHLDEATEKNINTSLMTLKMTQIIVAHRQETINLADRVIDLQF